MASMLPHVLCMKRPLVLRRVCQTTYGIFSRDFHETSLPVPYTCLVRPIKCTTTPLERRMSSATVYEGIFEQPIFEEKREYPIHELVNIQLTGYDFSLLESFQSHIHRLCKKIGVTVSDSWATPAQSVDVIRFKEDTTLKKEKFELKLYERNIQLFELNSIMAPLLADIIQSLSPVGVRVAFKYHTSEDTDVRYMPDVKMRELLEELEVIRENMRIL